MSAAPMSTTDIAPETVADVPAGAVADDARGGTLAALATWLTSSDSKVIGRNFIGCSLLALVGAAVLGVMLGAERIDGGDTLFDDGRVAADVRRLPHRPRVRSARPAAPRHRRRRRPVAGRRPLAGLPTARRGRVLGLVQWPRAGDGRPGQQRRPGRRQRGHGRSVHRRPGSARDRPRRRGPPGGGDRADDAGTWHAHGSRALLRLVRTRRLDRVPARAAGAARRAHLPVRRPPLRPRPVRRKLRRRGVGRLRPHPARHVSVRTACRRHRRRAVAGDLPQAHAAARRRVRRPRPGRGRGTLRRHPAGQPRPAVGGQRCRPRRDRGQGVRPRALRIVHPPAAARSGDRDARRRSSPPDRPATSRRGSGRSSRRRSSSPSSVSG